MIVVGSRALALCFFFHSLTPISFQHFERVSGHFYLKLSLDYKLSIIGSRLVLSKAREKVLSVQTSSLMYALFQPSLMKHCVSLTLTADISDCYPGRRLALLQNCRLLAPVPDFSM